MTNRFRGWIYCAIVGGVCIHLSISKAHGQQSSTTIHEIQLTARHLWNPYATDLADWQLLNQPRTIIKGPSGELIIADTENGRLVRIKSNGQLIETIGRPGEGPGEFTQPVDLSYSSSDSVLWIGDRRAGRILKYKLIQDSFQYLDSSIAPHLILSSSGSSLVPNNSDSYWFTARLPNDYRIQLFSRTGDVLMEFGDVWHPDAGESGNTGMLNMGQLARVDEARIAFVAFMRGEVEIWNEKGDRIVNQSYLERPFQWFQQNPAARNPGDIMYFGDIDPDPDTNRIYLLVFLAGHGENSIYGVSAETLVPEVRYILPPVDESFSPISVAVIHDGRSIAFYILHFRHCPSIIG